MRLRPEGPAALTPFFLALPLTVPHVARIVPIVLLAVFASPVHAQWTQYGGPNQDFKVADPGIALTWPDDGPRKIWSRKLGEGYSAILADQNRVYTMYRERRNEVVVCLDAKTGTTVWEYRYESMPIKGHESDYGNGPNATPLLYDGRLYTIGIAGLMRCLDATNGKLIWSHDLWFDYEPLPVNEFGYSSSPVAHDNTVIAQMGGKSASLAAFDAKDGRRLWKGLDYPTTFSTPKLMRLNGRTQLVVCTADGVIGVAVNKPQMLWRYPVVNREKQNIAMPVRLDDDELFFSTWEAGSRRLRLVEHSSPVPPPARDRVTIERDGIRVEEVWSARQPQFMYSSGVQFGDYIYGSTGTNVSAAMCAVNVRTGKLAWRERGFAVAHVVGVGEHLIILDDQGVLGLATPSPKGLTVHAKAQLLTAPSRTSPTVAGKTLYARDMRHIMALDLSPVED